MFLSRYYVLEKRTVLYSYLIYILLLVLLSIFLVILFIYSTCNANELNYFENSNTKNISNISPKTKYTEYIEDGQFLGQEQRLYNVENNYYIEPNELLEQNLGINVPLNSNTSNPSEYLYDNFLSTEESQESIDNYSFVSSLRNSSHLESYNNFDDDNNIFTKSSSNNYLGSGYECSIEPNDYEEVICEKSNDVMQDVNDDKNTNNSQIIEELNNKINTISRNIAFLQNIQHNSCYSQHLVESKIVSVDTDGDVSLKKCADANNCLELWLGENTDNSLEGNCAIFESNINLVINDISAISKIVIEEVNVDDYLELYLNITPAYYDDINQQNWEKIASYPSNLNFNQFFKKGCDNDDNMTFFPKNNILPIIQSKLSVLQNSQVCSFYSQRNLQSNSQLNSQSNSQNMFKIYLSLLQRLYVGGYGEGKTKIRIYLEEDKVITKDEYTNVECISNLIDDVITANTIETYAYTNSYSNDTVQLLNKCINNYSLDEKGQDISLLTYDNNVLIPKNKLSTFSDYWQQYQNYSSVQQLDKTILSIMENFDTSISPICKEFISQLEVPKSLISALLYQKKLTELSLAKYTQMNKNDKSNTSNIDSIDGSSNLTFTDSCTEKISQYPKCMLVMDNKNKQKYRCYKYASKCHSLPPNIGIDCQEIVDYQDDNNYINEQFVTEHLCTEITNEQYELIQDNCMDYKNSNCYLEEQRCFDIKCNEKEYKYSCVNSYSSPSKRIVRKIKCQSENKVIDDFICGDYSCLPSVEDSIEDKIEGLANSQMVEFMQNDVSCQNSNSQNPQSCFLFKGESKSCRVGLYGQMDCCNPKNGEINVFSYMKLASAIYLLKTSLDTVNDKNSNFGSWSSKELFNNGQGIISSPLDSIVGNIGNSNTKEVANQIGQELSRKIASYIEANFGKELKDKIIVETVNSEGTKQLQLNPGVINAAQGIMTYYLAYQTAKELLNIATSCHAEEVETSIQLNTNSCVHIDTVCDHSILGKCLIKKQIYCCYNSPLAKIVVPQLFQKGSISENDMCSGISLDKVAQIDWSNLNLDEWKYIVRNSELYSIDEFSLNGLTNSNSMLKTDNRINSLERTEKILMYNKQK